MIDHETSQKKYRVNVAMESVYNDTESCMISADQMSCQAQSMLALREFQNNRALTDYMIRHPVCERFQSLMDRNLESSMIYTEGTSLKKNCLPEGILKMTHGHYTLDQSGPWVNQHVPLRAPFQERFDIWTRAKGAPAKPM